MPCFNFLRFRIIIFFTRLTVVALVVGQVNRDGVNRVFGIGNRLNNELSVRSGNTCDQRLGGSYKCVSTSHWTDTGDTWNRGVEVEAFDVDKLAELEAIREYEFGVAVGERDVSGVERVGELYVKAVVRPEIGAGESRDNADDLEDGGAVVSGDASGGVHRLEEFEEDSLSEGSHRGDL